MWEDVIALPSSTRKVVFRRDRALSMQCNMYNSRQKGVRKSTIFHEIPSLLGPSEVRLHCWLHAPGFFIGWVPNKPHLELLTGGVGIGRGDSHMKIPHISWGIFSALGVKSDCIVRFTHRFFIVWVPGQPHLELLAVAVGMCRGSNHVSLPHFLMI